MVTYKDIDINYAILAFTEDKNEPRFLDVLNRQELKTGDEISISIKFKGSKESILTFNRTIKDIKNDVKEINTSDKGLVTLVAKDFILE